MVLEKSFCVKGSNQPTEFRSFECPCFWPRGGCQRQGENNTRTKALDDGIPVCLIGISFLIIVLI